MTLSRNAPAVRTPRIGFDFHYNARPFYDGARTYAESLVRGMDRLGSPFEWRLFTPRTDGEAETSFSSAFRLVRSPFTNNKLNLFFGYGRACQRHGIDLFHAQYFRPLNLPPRTRTVVTVHDILYERLPRFFPWRLRTQMRFLLPTTIRRADRIVASSNFTRNELIELYGLPSEKIEVIPCGVEPLWDAPPDSARVKAFEERVGLERPYVLTVGRLAPIKNLPGMLRAMKRLRDRDVNLTLAVVGGRDPSFPEKQFLRLRTELGLERIVKLLGSLPREEVGLLAAGAEMLWFPSFGEGFGIPAVEAMAAALPVIAGSGGALPETVGDAGLVVDPAEPAELAEATLRILEDRTAREELARRGVERAAGFTWRRAAEATLDVYRRVLGV